MRVGILVLISALASGATSVAAQSKPLSQLSLSHGQKLLSVRTYVFAAMPTSDAMKPALTCPMPVFRTPSAGGDPMPVARGGTTEPMPVARSGCWNPLFPDY